MRDRAWGRLYRRKTIGDLRFLSGAEPEEDTLFNDCYLNEHMGISVTNAKLYYYMRDDSAIHDEMSRRFLSSTEAIIGFLKDVPETEKRQKVIIRCYKMLLSVRYLEMYSADYSTIKMKCKSLFALLDPYLVELNFKEKVKYRILKDFPLLYRQWRIMGDPSLIQYEKEKRKKRQSIRFLG